MTLEHGAVPREPPLCHSRVVKICDRNLGRDSHTKRVLRSLRILSTGTGIGFRPSLPVAGRRYLCGRRRGRAPVPVCPALVTWGAPHLRHLCRRQVPREGLSLPLLASRFVSAEGERSVSHCVYCGFLWRHANHFWPTTPKSWSLNGHCHRAVVAQ